MFKKTVFLAPILVLMLTTSIMSCGESSSNNCKAVTIQNKGTYYQVVLNFQHTSHRNIGIEFGRKVVKMIPNFCELLDSYAADCTADPNIQPLYPYFIERTKGIKPQIRQEYLDEIDGMASVVVDTTENVRGDGHLSIDEVYLLNFMTDVLRPTQCSALSVYGPRSATGKTLVARMLDLYPGSSDQFTKLQAVVTYKNGNQSFCSIGILGCMGVISGFNNNKVFAAILDCGTGKPYDQNTAGKSSYIFDIRYALENCRNLKDTEDYLKSPARTYTYSHLIFFADPYTSEVLENNISDNFRAIRTDTSELDSHVTWGFDNAVGSVNSFILNGNYYTHDLQANLARWDSMKTQLAAKGEQVTVDELKEIITYKTGAVPHGQEDGDLYNTYSLQTIIFQPDNLSLQIFFRPVGGLPATPSFENVQVSLLNNK